MMENHFTQYLNTQSQENMQSGNLRAAIVYVTVRLFCQCQIAQSAQKSFAIEECSTLFVSLKYAFLGLRQSLANERPLKMMNKAFYFILKAFFVLEIFKFLVIYKNGFIRKIMKFGQLVEHNMRNIFVKKNHI